MEQQFLVSVQLQRPLHLGSQMSASQYEPEVVQDLEHSSQNAAKTPAYPMSHPVAWQGHEFSFDVSTSLKHLSSDP